MGATGSGGGARTHDKRINSPLLCQLSYPGREVQGYQRGHPEPKAVDLVRFEVTAQPLAVIGVAKAGKGLLFNLTDSLTSDTLLLSDIVECLRLATRDTKAFVNNAAVTIWQMI